MRLLLLALYPSLVDFLALQLFLMVQLAYVADQALIVTQREVSHRKRGDQVLGFDWPSCIIYQEEHSVSLGNGVMLGVIMEWRHVDQSTVRSVPDRMVYNEQIPTRAWSDAVVECPTEAGSATIPPDLPQHVLETSGWSCPMLWAVDGQPQRLMTDRSREYFYPVMWMDPCGHGVLLCDIKSADTQKRGTKPLARLLSRI